MEAGKSFFLQFISSGRENQNIQKSLLKTILLVGIIVLPVFLIIGLFDNFPFNPTDIIILNLLALYIFYYLLLKKDKLNLVSILFLITSWVALTFTAIRSAGVRDISIIGYLLLIVLSALMTSHRVAITLSVLTVISMWIMAFAEERGILVPFRDNPLTYTRDFTIVITLLVSAIVLNDRSFKITYDTKKNELDEKIIAEQRLSESQKLLTAKNLELLKAKEKAEQGEKLKTSFIQNVTHEIRTPMNGIVGFAELLKDSTLNEERRIEYLHYMTSCTKNLADIINDIIDISKIDAGDIDYNPVEFSAGILLEKCKSSCIETAELKRLDLVGIDNTGDIRIVSDIEKISRVISKLVCNGVKFTDHGNVTITISRVLNDLVISVSDTGIGISREQVEIIFDKFRQADYSMTRSYTGAGLGLSISKGIVDFMGGKITVDSSPGRGSDFKVIIPVEFPEA